MAKNAAMTTEPKDVRLPIMVTASEAEAIDEWRFANRIGSRAEAIRRLIAIGLRASSREGTLNDIWSTAQDGMGADELDEAVDALGEIAYDVEDFRLYIFTGAGCEPAKD